MAHSRNQQPRAVDFLALTPDPFPSQNASGQGVLVGRGEGRLSMARSTRPQPTFPSAGWGNPVPSAFCPVKVRLSGDRPAHYMSTHLFQGIRHCLAFNRYGPVGYIA